MDVEWSGLARTGKATVIGGVLVLLGTVLPWMTWSGGSASLLQDGKMEIGVSTGMGSDMATVAPSSYGWIALFVAAVAIAVPLVRGWNWKTALAGFLIGTIAYSLFGLSALVLHDGTDEGAFVEGEQVAQSASMGSGVYVLLFGTVILSLAGLAYLVAAGVGKLRS